MRNDALMRDHVIRSIRLSAVVGATVLLTTLSSAAQSTEPSPRVYSKEKPLFDRSVPDVTPGQGGETRAVVEPQRRDRDDAKAGRAPEAGNTKAKTTAETDTPPAEPPTAVKQAAPAPKPEPAKRLTRDIHSEPAPASPYAPKSARQSATADKKTRTKTTQKPEATGRKSAAGTSGVEIINPSGPAAAATASTRKK